MSKILRTSGGFVILAVIAVFFAACSTPKYYVFKTIKHTPTEKNDAPQKNGNAVAENQLPQDLKHAGTQDEALAVASVKKIS